MSERVIALVGDLQIVVIGLQIFLGHALLRFFKKLCVGHVHFRRGRSAVQPISIGTRTRVKWFAEGQLSQIKHTCKYLRFG